MLMTSGLNYGVKIAECICQMKAMLVLYVAPFSSKHVVTAMNKHMFMGNIVESVELVIRRYTALEGMYITNRSSRPRMCCLFLNAFSLPKTNSTFWATELDVNCQTMEQ